MKQLQHSLIIALGLSIYACGNAPQKTTHSSADTSKDSSATALSVDADELLDVLQGRWQSEKDAAYEVEFSGSKVRHFNSGKLTQESDIEVDAACSTNACTSDSTATLSGWCFVEKGQYDAQCCIVTKCDSATLRYHAIGAAGSGQVFRRK